HTRSKRDWSSDVCSSDLPVDIHHRRCDILIYAICSLPVTVFATRTARWPKPNRPASRSKIGVGRAPIFRHSQELEDDLHSGHYCYGHSLSTRRVTGHGCTDSWYQLHSRAT